MRPTSPLAIQLPAQIPVPSQPTLAHELLIELPELTQQQPKTPSQLIIPAQAVLRKRDITLQPAILHAMKIFLGKETATWSCPSQAEALDCILRGQENLVVVMGPGTGKSLLFMLPASIQRGGGVTVVISFYKALTSDMLRRCGKAGINAAKYRSGEHNVAARILFVSAENATDRGFLRYARSIGDKLKRVFIDECHSPHSQGHFRPGIVDLSPLGLLGVPMYALTGTLPPGWEVDVAARFGIYHYRLIRDSTVRPQQAYRVLKAITSQDHGNLIRVIGAEVDKAQHQMERLEKGIVFCRWTAVCDTLSARWGGVTHHRDNSEEANEAGLKEWMNGTTKFMFATSGLGTGIDLPNVRYVFHCSQPWSLLDYYQQASRGGRDGGKVLCTLIWDEVLVSNKDDISALFCGADEMIHYMKQNEVCRRYLLGKYLDGYGVSCTATPSAHECDVCSAMTNETIHALPPPPSNTLPHHTLTRRQGEERGITTNSTFGAMVMMADDIKIKRCAYCWARGLRVESPHDFSECDDLDQSQVSLPRDQRTWAKAIRFASFSCCYFCWLPRDDAERYFHTKTVPESGGQPMYVCLYKDLLPVIAYLVSISDTLRERARTQLGVRWESKEGYYEWLTNKNKESQLNNSLHLVEAFVDLHMAKKRTQE